MYITEVISPSQDNSLKISTDNCSSILEQTIDCIRKDFEKYGYSIHYTGHPEEAYEQIVTQLKGIVEDIIKESYSKLIDILSAIGLNEKNVKDQLSYNPHLAPSKIISRLIMEREFKKVCDCASYGAE